MAKVVRKSEPTLFSTRARPSPVAEMRPASVVHRGTMDGVAPASEALTRWSEDSSFTWADPTRELYHEWHNEDSTRHVTELQLPIAR
jgi:effector-binding domain-containing protein